MMLVAQEGTWRCHPELVLLALLLVWLSAHCMGKALLLSLLPG